MGGYAGDSYRPGTDRERFIGGCVVALFLLAFVAFLTYCGWTKS